MNLRDKYSKVKKLVTEGATEGERVAAKEAMLRMEQSHPELLTRKAVPEDVFKGYQANVTWDEFTNLSEDFYNLIDSILSKKEPSGTWVGIDFASSESSQTWYKSSDGRWRPVK